MNKKNNFKVQNLAHSNHDSDLSNLQSQRDKLKLKIMSKYNVSSEEANKILIKIEESEKLKFDKKIILNNNASDNFDTKYLSDQKNTNLNKNVEDSKIRSIRNIDSNKE